MNRDHRRSHKDSVKAVFVKWRETDEVLLVRFIMSVTFRSPLIHLATAGDYDRCCESISQEDTHFNMRHLHAGILLTQLQQLVPSPEIMIDEIFNLFFASVISR